jgi:hypothetical protein
MTMDTHAPTPHEPPNRDAQALAAGERMSAARAPSQPVRARPGTIVDQAALRLTHDAAVKHNTSAGRPGYSSATSRWQTHLHVEAWVRNASYAKRVWVDARVFGRDGELVESGTFALSYARPAGDGGDVFQLDQAVHEGAHDDPGIGSAAV